MSQPETAEKVNESVESEVQPQSHPESTLSEDNAISAPSDDLTEPQLEPQLEPQQQLQTESEQQTKPPQTVNPQSNNRDEESQNNLTLPIAKIKRIFKMDQDYAGASSSAVYTAGLATELFVQYFAEQASLLAKMEKRKKIQYKDFANAVSAHDSLNFLGDTVPKTQSIGELVQQNKVHVKESSTKVNKPSSSGVSKGATVTEVSSASIHPKDILPKGQQTLNFPIANASTIKKTEGTQKNSILDLVTRDDDETDADQDVVMRD